MSEVPISRRVPGGGLTKIKIAAIPATLVVAGITAFAARHIMLVGKCNELGDSVAESAQDLQSDLDRRFRFTPTGCYDVIGPNCPGAGIRDPLPQDPQTCERLEKRVRAMRKRVNRASSECRGVESPVPEASDTVSKSERDLRTLCTSR